MAEAISSQEEDVTEQVRVLPRAGAASPPSEAELIAMFSLGV